MANYSGIDSILTQYTNKVSKKLFQAKSTTLDSLISATEAKGTGLVKVIYDSTASSTSFEIDASQYLTPSDFSYDSTTGILTLKFM